MEEGREDRRTSPTPGLKKGDEVVYTGGAFKLVSSWLGGDSDDDNKEKNELQVETEGRPPGLGLGAKFLPHKKAIALNAGADRSLAKRLKNYSKPSERGNPSNAQTRETDALQTEDTTSDEEMEESRTQAFSRNSESAVGNKRPRPMTREELLQVEQPSSSKRKRKKRKKKKKGGN